MEKSNLYTLRWYAKKISEFGDAKVKALAAELEKEITVMLGEKVPAGEAPLPPVNPGKTIGRLGIVVGHTKKSQGASGIGIGSEYVYNSDLAEKIAAFGKSVGVEVFIEKRDSGGIAGAFKRVLAKKPDAVVELHFNSADAKSATGCETLYSDSKDIAGIREMILAKTMSEYMAKALGLPLRHKNGLKKLASKGERGFGNLMQSTNVACVLVEPGFGSNVVDSKALKDKKDEYAASIVKAFLTWKNA